MLRIVDFALKLCSEITEGPSSFTTATAARDICLEAFNELQNRVDLLQDQAACQTTGIVTCKRNRSQKPGFQHLHAYLQQNIIEFTCRSLHDTARLFRINSFWHRNICENSCRLKLQEAVRVRVGCMDSILMSSVKMLGLYHLNLSKSTNITDAGVQSLSGLLSLQLLHLNGCGKITDAGVQSLPVHVNVDKS